MSPTPHTTRRQRAAAATCANARPSLLDELYANKPDTRRPLLWPVFGREGTVAWFSDYGSAVSFVSASLGHRNLFVGEPEYQA